jgi:hypothetical protein
VRDKRAKGCQRDASVHMQEVTGAAWEAMTRQSVRRLAKQIGVSTSTAWKICRDDLSPFLYIMQLNLPSPEDGTATNYAFARNYGPLLGAIQVSRIRFADET